MSLPVTGVRSWPATWLSEPRHACRTELPSGCALGRPLQNLKRARIVEVFGNYALLLLRDYSLDVHVTVRLLRSFQISPVSAPSTWVCIGALRFAAVEITSGTKPAPKRRQGPGVGD